eukprot:5199495-Pyramimonas_sp.AAC.1
MRECPPRSKKLASKYAELASTAPAGSTAAHASSTNASVSPTPPPHESTRERGRGGACKGGETTS